MLWCPKILEVTKSGVLDIAWCQTGLVSGLRILFLFIYTDPQQTAFPLGAYEQAITQVVGMVIAYSLLVVKASHRIILPS